MIICSCGLYCYTPRVAEMAKRIKTISTCWHHSAEWILYGESFCVCGVHRDVHPTADGCTDFRSQFDARFTQEQIDVWLKEPALWP